MRRQLCLILEPQWSKLATWDCIRRILKEAIGIVNIAVEIVLKLLFVLTLLEHPARL